MAAARSRTFRVERFLTALTLVVPAIVTLTAGSAAAQTDPNPTAPPNPVAPAAPAAPAGGDSPMSGVPTVRRVQEPAGDLTPAGNAGAALDPNQDKNELVAQGQNRPTMDPGLGTIPSSVYADDWWSHVHPVVELHGYFRTRGEMYHNFSLGRADGIGAGGLWPRPLDDSYNALDRNGVSPSGTGQTVALCGKNALGSCTDKTQAFGNMRLRLNPELHISDNLRVLSQIDALDNVVMGSSPANYSTASNPNGGATTGYANDTQNAPPNSIAVKRVWAEYTTPVGQLRFGRMPTHWGLGMLYNDGNGVDQDYQSNNDRIQFVTGLRSIDLYAGGSWDFANSGPTSSTPFDANGGQPYNTANRMNAGQWTLFVARRTNPELQRTRLTRGNVVVNGGLYNVFRTQGLDYQYGATAPTPGVGTNNGFEHRGLTVYSPDAWIQVLWRKLRIEAEAAAHLGSVDQTKDFRLPTSTGTEGADAVPIRQFGGVIQAEYKAVEDKLRMQFSSGWASGDPWAASLSSNRQLNNSAAIQSFAFNPAYNVDLIFHRRLLQRVQGTYFFKPSVEYDFIRNPNGQKFGGGASFVWTRASQFVQTPGSKRDLGVEIDLQVYYQAKDGTLNDDPKKMGGFYTMLQYGAFFPLGGLQYPEVTTTATPAAEVSTAQVIRLHVGVVF